MSEIVRKVKKGSSVAVADAIPVYGGLDEKDRDRLIEDVKASFARAAAALSDSEDKESADEIVGPTSTELVEIPQFSELVGIEPSVYRQINGALHAGKQHLMFYGHLVPERRRLLNSSRALSTTPTR